MFRSRRSKSLNITERDPTYKVKYLGNVLTAFMKGEGCVDRPASVLWNNFLSNPDAAVDMQLTICTAGLKVQTKQQGLTEYRAHRISYCICHPQYPRIFIWVYRHEAKKMKIEVRCHAVICKSEPVAKAVAVQLHDKLSFALSEFTREKTRRQRARLSLQRTNSLPNGGSIGSSISSAALAGAPVSAPGVSAGGISVRTKFLTVGQNFKPPTEQSAGAPKLGAISEDLEEVADEEEDDEVKRKTNLRRGGGDEGVHDDEDNDESVFINSQSNENISKDIRRCDSRFLSFEIVSDLSSTNISNNNNDDDDGHDNKIMKASCKNDRHTTTTTASAAADEVAAAGTSSGLRSKVINGESLDGLLIDLEIGNDIPLFKMDSKVQLEILAQNGDSDSESGFSE